MLCQSNIHIIEREVFNVLQSVINTRKTPVAYLEGADEAALSEI